MCLPTYFLNIKMAVWIRLTRKLTLDLRCRIHACPCRHVPQGKLQTRSQSPQVSRSAGCRRERPWGTGVLDFLPQKSSSYRFLVLLLWTAKQKNIIIFFHYSWVSLGADCTLTKKPEDSGNEIKETGHRIFARWRHLTTTTRTLRLYFEFWLDVAKWRHWANILFEWNRE